MWRPPYGQDIRKVGAAASPADARVAAGDPEAVRASGPIRRDLITIRDWIGEKLLRRLRCGELVAWGRSEAAGWRFVCIPTWLWDRIAVLDWELGEVGRELPDGTAVHSYFEVVVGPADEPAAVAPEGTADSAAEPAPPPAVSTIAAQNRCQAWLMGLMKGDSQPEGPKNHYYTQARERFGPALSERGFLRAWANARAETKNPHWGRVGRPRKSTR